ITGNKSTSTTYPHGGGGVYVAQGAFEMLEGEITGNKATRQGGGVFVHWATGATGTARFGAYGNAAITGNDGVGSSAAICNRGITELLSSARADKVYIWDYEGADPPQEFTLVPSVQVGGVALAYSAVNKNYITLVDDHTGWTGGTGQICLIDLESHLSGGVFAGQLEPDWLGKKVVKGNNTTLTAVLSRLPLNSFTGTPSVYNLGAKYQITVHTSGPNDGFGTFEK
ncbi:MAG: hypothetical protein LBF95_05335, partial [Treponema sp.]|nr:hypothetical protein [Treponema sp.]